MTDGLVGRSPPGRADVDKRTWTGVSSPTARWPCGRRRERRAGVFAKATAPRLRPPVARRTGQCAPPRMVHAHEGGLGSSAGTR